MKQRQDNFDFSIGSNANSFKLDSPNQTSSCLSFSLSFLFLFLSSLSPSLSFAPAFISPLKNESNPTQL